MITTNISEAFINAQKLPCFAHKSKNIHIPAGYCIINPVSGKYYAQVTDDYDFVNHEEYVKRLNLQGLIPEWVYFDDREAHFFCPLSKIPIGTGLQNGSNIQLYAEAINSYDGHKARKIYLTIKLNGNYLFSDLPHIMSAAQVIKLLYSNPIKVARFLPDERIPKELLKKVSDFKEMTIEKWAEFFDEWKDSSFLIARRTSIKLINKIL